ncbi:MAG: hypothetical protein ACREOE_20725, partial [Gemmatimonadales bacterium]
MNEDTRNWIAFSVVALILFFAYQQFIIDPAAKHAEAARARAASAPAAVARPEHRLTRPQALA